jgi:cytochrome oxidase Cu insertion factor (SCO1/SenC/PrrC family)
MRRLSVLLLLAALLPAAPSLAAEPEGPLAVGERAPDFTLRDQHGRVARRSDLLRGSEYVVLAFYVKAFTPG